MELFLYEVMHGETFKLFNGVTGEARAINPDNVVVLPGRGDAIDSYIYTVSAAARADDIMHTVIAVDDPGSYVEGVPWDETGDPVKDLQAVMDAHKNAPMKGHTITDLPEGVPSPYESFIELQNKALTEFMLTGKMPEIKPLSKEEGGE
jgi:hypothetical protein